MSESQELPEEMRGKYATQGVESTVRDRDRETIGHVGLFDLDEVAIGTAWEAAERLPGPVAVLRTSRRGFHVWSLAVRQLGEWIERGEEIEGVDPDHIALMEARECSVARIAPKTALATGEHVRPEPSVVAYRTADDEGQVSEPHARILRERFQQPQTPVDGPAEWVGHSAPRRTFMAEIGGQGGE